MCIPKSREGQCPFVFIKKYFVIFVGYVKTGAAVGPTTARKKTIYETRVGGSRTCRRMEARALRRQAGDQISLSGTRASMLSRALTASLASRPWRPAKWGRFSTASQGRT